VITEPKRLAQLGLDPVIQASGTAASPNFDAKARR
jgi:hypothetical protein